MKLKINEVGDICETEVVINCRKADGQVLRMAASLRAFDKKITGIKDGQTFLLEAPDILYADTADRKTFFYTKDGVYETPLKLYELEERLAGSDFFRASKSTIINFNQIRSLRPEFGGKFLLTMNSGERLYVSRQYAGTVKEKLGLI